METKCLHSREWAKVVSKEPVFKCGLRGHTADRCWQKGKGEGGKGDWETGDGWIQKKGMVQRKIGQTVVIRQDSSWCNSLEHRQNVWS